MTSSGEQQATADPWAWLHSALRGDRPRDPAAAARAQAAGAPLHSEHDGVVTATAPWGATVELAGGVVAVVDVIKGGASLKVGDTAHVAILDDDRDPVRCSTLTEDLAIARRLRR